MEWIAEGLTHPGTLKIPTITKSRKLRTLIDFRRFEHMRFWSVNSFFLLFQFLCFSFSWAETPHTITIDGIIDFSRDELIVDDSSTDSFWGSYNEIDNLYLTWDANFLYLGGDYVVSNNAFILFLDLGLGSGDRDVNNLDWYPRDFQFSGAEAEFILALWDANIFTGGVRKITGDGTTEEVSVLISNSASHDNKGSIEAGISWENIFGMGKGRVKQGSILKLVAVIAGGDHSGGSDSAPDNEGVRGGGSTRLRTFFQISIDSDNDGWPDLKVKPSSAGMVVTSPKIVQRFREFSLTPRVFSPKKEELKLFFITSDDGEATIKIFDEEGKFIRNLGVRLRISGGDKIELNWDGKDERGRPCRAGIYIISVLLDDSVREKAAFVLIK